ncbi:hypothetical protein Btru_068810 [Bulinus truncatus]|nr:hypothetical protein Btru_068810 [Bulinus truncatus]
MRHPIFRLTSQQHIVYPYHLYQSTMKSAVILLCVLVVAVSAAGSYYEETEESPSSKGYPATYNRYPTVRLYYLLSSGYPMIPYNTGYNNYPTADSSYPSTYSYPAASSYPTAYSNYPAANSYPSVYSSYPSVYNYPTNYRMVGDHGYVNTILSNIYTKPAKK